MPFLFSLVLPLLLGNIVFPAGEEGRKGREVTWRVESGSFGERFCLGIR